MQDYNKDKRVRAIARLGLGGRVAVASCTRMRMPMLASGWRVHELVAQFNLSCELIVSRPGASVGASAGSAEEKVQTAAVQWRRLPQQREAR